MNRLLPPGFVPNVSTHYNPDSPSNAAQGRKRSTPITPEQGSALASNTSKRRYGHSTATMTPTSVEEGRDFMRLHTQLAEIHKELREISHRQKYLEETLTKKMDTLTRSVTDMKQHQAAGEDVKLLRQSARSWIRWRLFTEPYEAAFWEDVDTVYNCYMEHVGKHKGFVDGVSISEATSIIGTIRVEERSKLKTRLMEAANSGLTGPLLDLRRRVIGEGSPREGITEQDILTATARWRLVLLIHAEYPTTEFWVFANNQFASLPPDWDYAARDIAVYGLREPPVNNPPAPEVTEAAHEATWRGAFEQQEEADKGATPME